MQSLRLPLLSALLLALSTAVMCANTPYYQFVDASDSVAVRQLVARYLAYTVSEPIPIDSISNVAADELRGKLEKSFGVPLRFPSAMPSTVGQARSLRPDGSVAIVLVAVDAGAVPGFGRLVVDWVFFARRVDSLGWRLTAIRRQNGVEDALEQLKYLDTTALYPARLKPTVAREVSGVLRSNEQLRTTFAEHRERFSALASHFNGRDSLQMMARVDRVPAQINNVAILWGDGGYEIPADIAEEFAATLTAEQRAGFQAQMRAAAAQRRAGRDSVKAIARRLRLRLANIDSTIELMRELGINFANGRLPWKGAVQFSAGGLRDDVVGYLYSPHGEVPYVSEQEYFYLEDLGGGWWLFRAT